MLCVQAERQAALDKAGAATKSVRELRGAPSDSCGFISFFLFVL